MCMVCIYRPISLLDRRVENVHIWSSVNEPVASIRVFIWSMY